MLLKTIEKNNTPIRVELLYSPQKKSFFLLASVDNHTEYPRRAAVKFHFPANQYSKSAEEEAKKACSNEDIDTLISALYQINSVK